MNRYFKILTGVSCLILCFPFQARANAIIPYMVVPWGQLFLLPLVIFIEGKILHKLAGGKTSTALLQSLVANIISTAVGALIYLATMPLIEEKLFQWWFKGGFGSEALRSAFIALVFAIVLYFISWLSETAIIARMRKAQFKKMAIPCATANLITYVLLLGCALLS